MCRQHLFVEPKSVLPSGRPAFFRKYCAFHKCICVKDAVITSEQHAENTRKAAEQKQDTASERIPIRHAVSPDNNAENAKCRKTDKPDASGNTESFRNSHAFPIRIFFVFSVDIFVCPFVKQLRQQCRNGVGKQRDHWTPTGEAKYARNAAGEKAALVSSCHSSSSRLSPSYSISLTKSCQIRSRCSAV